ncbi:MAG: hypothetical protein IMW89_10355 [Ktedonobacteraceae bacterium]|nr:hypothetical protein [Ktedonobacteraceae bacterium]
MLKQPGIYALLFTLCLLISLAPLKRLGGIADLMLPTNKLLMVPGFWLPVDLHFTADARISQWTTHVVLFLSLLGLAFVIYLACTRWLQRQPAQGDFRQTRRLIYLVTIVSGLAFLLTPAMLSHDIFVYAGYGRILTIHHANPYFTTLSMFPQDPFNRLDDWKNVLSAYGPLWTALCGLIALLAGDDPARTILLYRGFALASHLLNISLIAAILGTLGRSPRTITLGMLLYAWNPLVLEESSLGAHNDTFMMTLVLAGFFFSVRTVQNLGQHRPSLLQSLPALVAFTLAALVKFTAAPVLFFFLLLLARQAYDANLAHVTRIAAGTRQYFAHLKAIALIVVPAGAVSGTLALVLYLPYWSGFTLDMILYSFTSPPSSRSSYGSILYAIVAWNHDHGLPPQGTWMHFIVDIFGRHQTWNVINLITFVSMLLIGALWIWRQPAVRTTALATLALLGAVLIVTHWFFPWYLTWLIGLAAICLPTTYDRVGRALLAFALTFSASALCSYLYANFRSPIGGWTGLSFLTTLAPPLIMLCLFLVLPLNYKKEIVVGTTPGTISDTPGTPGDR